MRFGKTREDLEAELREIDSELAAHPYNSPTAVATNEIIERFDSEGKERIAEELTARGLPSLDQHGLLIAKGALSFGRLNRRRAKVSRRLERNGSK